jgi:vacuolar-type H+-ATPase subunit H
MEDTMPDIEVTEVTAQPVGTKLKNAFKRIKAMWEDKNKDIKKIEKKMEKLQEDMFVLKEERENIEDELEGIRTTYESFCEQTGIRFDLQ